MLVLMLLLGILIGVVLATKWIGRRLPPLRPPDSVWVKDRWYTADQISALSMAAYVPLRPYLLSLRPEGWVDIELDAATIQAENDRMVLNGELDRMTSVFPRFEDRNVKS